MLHAKKPPRAEDGRHPLTGVRMVVGALVMLALALGIAACGGSSSSSSSSTAARLAYYV